MLRLQWDDLPDETRTVIQRGFGAVSRVTSVGARLTRGVASRLYTESGVVFLKAVPLRSPSLAHYEREQRVNVLLPASVPAPRLLWSGRCAGWLLLIFECLDGRPADPSPGSPDIPGLLDTVAELGKMLTPCPWPGAPEAIEKIDGMRGYARLANLGDFPAPHRYAAALERLDADALTGNTLLHADLHEENFQVIGGRAHVIDWSLACRGARWLDIVLLLPRFIMAGHTPEQAERLAAGVPAWHDAPAEVVTDLAALRTLFSAYLAVRGPEHLRARRARVAAAGRAWVAHRIS
ncbi:phosphotransferase family protein [Acrocarpospora catenulata]|uniref:phosphotransferase family protein n=1 Tax=Acrocarpospora catenulata TaxID=2836182 RepID=UPI001BD96F59|nr:phosphotransferase [Acrocarpospora catenulata]